MKNLHKLFFLAAILMMSCEGPIGPEGPEGPAGPTGATGATGSTGSTGADGSDGADGNANVQTIIYTNPTWSSNIMDLTVSQITQDVYDNDLVLGYIDIGSGIWYGSDAHYNGVGYFRSYYGVGFYTIKAHNLDDTADTTPPTVSRVKLIIIESTSTTSNSGNGRTASPQAIILKELADEGVDINDYYAVMAYYNLND